MSSLLPFTFTVKVNEALTWEAPDPLESSLVGAAWERLLDQATKHREISEYVRLDEQAGDTVQTTIRCTGQEFVVTIEEMEPPLFPFQFKYPIFLGVDFRIHGPISLNDHLQELAWAALRKEAKKRGLENDLELLMKHAAIRAGLTWDADNFIVTIDKKD